MSSAISKSDFVFKLLEVVSAILNHFIPSLFF